MGRSTRNGYSIVELLIVSILIGILAAVSIPRLGFSVVFKSRAEAASLKLAAAIRRTRLTAITHAAENPAGYEIHTGPAGYRITSLGPAGSNVAARVDSCQIDQRLSCGDASFRFGPLGNLLQGSDSQVTISHGDTAFLISVTPATGMVQCVKN